MLHADADPGAIARAASAGTVTASSFARRAFMLSFPPSLNPTWVMLGAGGRAISHTAAGETSGFASPPHGGFAVASARAVSPRLGAGLTGRARNWTRIRPEPQKSSRRAVFW